MKNDGMAIFVSLLLLGAAAFLIFTTVAILPVVFVLGTPLLGYLAWLNSPWREEQRQRSKTARLYRKALSVVKPHDDTDDFFDALEYHYPGNTPDELKEALKPIAEQLRGDISASGLPAPPELYDSIEGARYQDELNRIINTSQISSHREVAEVISEAFYPFLAAVPRQGGELHIKAIDAISDLPRVIEEIIAVFMDTKSNHFRPLVRQLEKNFDANDQVLPRKYRGDDVLCYLHGTPLYDLFRLSIPFGFTDEHRFEHTHMVAQTGYGKTQSMQYFIAHDLPKVRDGEASVVVIDSQAEMIQKLLRLELIPPEDIIWINPRDIAHPPALNLFDTGLTRSYTPAQKEQLTNATIEMYEYLFGGIFGADLTSKQSVFFRFVIRLMMTIPNATIDTLLALLRSPDNFEDYIAKLSGPAREFFEVDFINHYRHTRDEVTRRVFTVVENPTLYRMFNTPHTKIDLFAEMNQGKLILIDTANDMLKGDGAKIVGRFFFAKLIQAAQERAFLSSKLPVYVYVDEAHEYLDEKTDVFLSQLRKQRIAGFFAHQYLDQIPVRLRKSFMSNTNTKLVGGLSSDDARAFAGEMRRPADYLTGRSKGTFVVKTPDLDKALPVHIPFGVIEQFPKRSKQSWQEMVYTQRWHYSSVPPTDKNEPKAPNLGKLFPIPVPMSRWLTGPSDDPVKGKKRPRR